MFLRMRYLLWCLGMKWLAISQHRLCRINQLLNFIDNPTPNHNIQTLITHTTTVTPIQHYISCKMKNQVLIYGSYVYCCKQLYSGCCYFALLFQMMAQRSTHSIEQQENLLSQELNQYRKINFKLRRKLKEKDHKIWSLLGIIEQAAQPIHLTPQPLKKKHLHQRQYSLKMSLSEQKKQRQENQRGNVQQQKENLFESNIFRDSSLLSLKKDQLRLKLPTIQAKSRIQNSNQCEGTNQKQTKKLKIPLDKLIPLQRSEVKRRFLERYKRQTAANQ